MEVTWIQRGVGIYILFNVGVLIILISQCIKRNREPKFMTKKYIVGIFILAVLFTILKLNDYHNVLRTINEQKHFPLMAMDITPETITGLIILLIVMWSVPIINCLLYIFLKKSVPRQNEK